MRFPLYNNCVISLTFMIFAVSLESFYKTFL